MFISVFLLTAAELGLQSLITQSQSRGDDECRGGGGGSGAADATYTPLGTCVCRLQYCICALNTNRWKYSDLHTLEIQN